MLAKEITDEIVKLSNELEEHTIQIRRKIHNNPELSFQENKTSELVISELKRIGIPYTLSPVKPGIIATIDSGKAGKLLMLRADMDALPIQEDTGLPFASSTPNVMHACGHDVHTSNLISVAEILQRTKKDWNGRVKLVFQPGEENGGGGRRMIENGLMDELPDACFALHVMPFDRGVITLGTGAVTSYSDGFYINIKGVAAHSSTPQKGVNAINIAAAIINSLNTVLTSNVSPLDSSTMNIGVIKGGHAPNVIADSVELNGMMRNETPEARAVMLERIQKIVEGTAQTLGGSGQVRFRTGYAATYNDPGLAKFAENVFTSNKESLYRGIIDGTDVPGNWLKTGKQFSLSAEDFGFYAQKAPSCFIWVGTGGESTNHSPKFTVEERYIKLCTRAMALFSLEYLNTN